MTPPPPFPPVPVLSIRLSSICSPKPNPSGKLVSGPLSVTFGVVVVVVSALGVCVVV